MLTFKKASKGWFWHPVDPSTGNAAPERFGPFADKRKAVQEGLVAKQAAEREETETAGARALLRYDGTSRG